MTHNQDKKIEETINDTVHRATDKMNDVVNETGERLREFLESEETIQHIKKAAEDLDRFVQKNPWTSVVGALAIGYFVGSIGRRK